MGKKGSWFSAIKRVFIHSPKDRPTHDSDKKSIKEKKNGKGILRHGETKSLIPLFREPSSIEKILGEADQLLIRPATSSEEPNIPPTASSPKPPSPRVVSSPKAPSPPKASNSEDALSKAAASPKATQSEKDISYVQWPEPTVRNQQLSATKIQAAYRGYVARRSFRALRGLVRLQGVVRGQNVKRQMANAMKQMQLLVRVQTQIQSWRIEMLENQALHHQAYRNCHKEVESTVSKWTLNRLSEAGESEDWDDSLLTKEEEEARLRKKVEAVMKRERAMAYAYSHQLWKTNPKSTQSPLKIRSNGFPWWWNWLERHPPPPPASTSQTPTATKNIITTPPRPISDKPSPRLHGNNFTFDTHESPTARSSKSTIPLRPKLFQTPPAKYSKRRRSGASSAYDHGSLKDDDSLISCPPFSVPNYMTPTASAKAKVRANSNPKERFPGTPDSERRFSFPLTPNIGSLKWNKDSASRMVLGKHESSCSVGDFSVDSTVSMQAALVGRKAFNRFM